MRNLGSVLAHSSLGAKRRGKGGGGGEGGEGRGIEQKGSENTTETHSSLKHVALGCKGLIPPKETCFPVYVAESVIIQCNRVV